MSDGLRDTRILVVDDDDDLRAQIARFLTQQGCVARVASDVAGARAVLSAEGLDICLVDIVMPGTSGKVLCREILERHGIPVVMMSSLSDEDTVVALLELGADDFLRKPFPMREMLARLRAVLRRRHVGAPSAQSQTRVVGGWTFDIVSRRLVGPDQFVRKLTPGETEVLRFLTNSPGTVFSREDLLAVSRTRQHTGASDRSMDMLIKRLRKKVERDPSEPEHVVTVWGKGYRYDP